jgi:hypothetical protein
LFREPADRNRRSGLVHLHLPDYREQSTNPLDIVGLILFGSGIALLSYVLEIFGDHSLDLGEILGLLALLLTLITGYARAVSQPPSLHECVDSDSVCCPHRSVLCRLNLRAVPERLDDGRT